MFYYLTTSYNIMHMALDDESELCGPFDTEGQRLAALDEDLEQRDLETEEVVQVTLLEVREGKLSSTSSFLAGDNTDPFWMVEPS